MGVYLYSLSGARPSASSTSSSQTSVASSSSCSDSDVSAYTNITPPTSASTSTFPESVSKETGEDIQVHVQDQGKQRGRSPARSAPPVLRAQNVSEVKTTARHRSRLLLDLVAKGQVPLNALLAFPIDFTRLAQQDELTSVARPRCPKSVSASTVEGAEGKTKAGPRPNRASSDPSRISCGMRGVPPSRKRQRRCIELPEEGSIDTVAEQPKRLRLQASPPTSASASAWASSSPPSSTQSLPTLGSLAAPSLLERRRRKSRATSPIPGGMVGAPPAGRRPSLSEPPCSFGYDDPTGLEHPYRLALEGLPRPPVIEVVFVETVKMDGSGRWTVCPRAGAAWG